jgi:hypothetical protein
MSKNINQDCEQITEELLIQLVNKAIENNCENITICDECDLITHGYKPEQPIRDFLVPDLPKPCKQKTPSSSKRKSTTPTKIVRQQDKQVSPKPKRTTQRRGTINKKLNRKQLPGQTKLTDYFSVTKTIKNAKMVSLQKSL